MALWDRLSRRVCEESGVEPVPLPTRLQANREWEEVAKGLFCRLLSLDEDRGRVTMLVRLAPGTDYPSHRHGDFEELHLLHGELQIDDKKLHAGDFIRAEGGSADHLAFSKKLENFEAAIGLHFAAYNFVKRHNGLRMTPATALGIEGDFWGYRGEDGKNHYMAVLRISPVNSPQSAVKVAIAAQVKNENKKR